MYCKMLLQRIKVFCGFMMALGCQGHVTHAVESVKHHRIPSPSTTPFPWATEVWSANDEPFRAAKIEVDRELKTARNRDAVVQKYKGLADPRPRQALAVFRWAYASYQVAETKRPFDSYYMWEPYQALQGTASPTAYEYARMRFLIEGFFYDRYTHLSVKKLGQRLLKRDPKDYRVKVALCEVLSYGGTLAERREGVKLATELVKANPKSVVRHGRLGNLYYALWMGSQLTSDRKAAIAAYKEFLKLGGIDATQRKITQNQIKLLEKSRDIPRKSSVKQVRTQPAKARKQ